MVAAVRFFMIFLWTGLMVPLSLILRFIFANHKIPLIMARNQWGRGILWFAGIKLKVYGLEKLDFSIPRVYVANHSSYLDIPCLFVGLPVNLYFVAKEEVKKIPFVGFFMKATKMIFINRKDTQKAIESLNTAGTLVKKGKSVLIFPEGTRSADGSIKRFKKGAFALAKNSDIPVVPVAIRGSFDVLPADTWRIKPGEVSLHFGEPMVCPDEMALDPFVKWVHEKTCALHQEASSEKLLIA